MVASVMKQTISQWLVCDHRPKIVGCSECLSDRLICVRRRTTAVLLLDLDISRASRVPGLMHCVAAATATSITAMHMHVYTITWSE